MFVRFNYPNFCLGMIAMLLLAAAHTVNAQCGVYLRHKSTQFFPYQKTNLDRAADMNGDGKIDLLATQYTDPVFSRDRIYIIPNDGNAVFGTPTIINPPSGKFSYQYFVGKVDNNSSNDIIAYPDFGGGSDTPTIIVYLNNGNGTFGAPVISSGSGRGIARELVDVNNDNKNDYISFTGSAVFSYSLGNGDGTFQSPVQISNNDGVAGSVDFNNDGKIDFINARHVYINNGNGTFTAVSMSQYLASNESPYLVRDLNGDGLTDILVATPNGWRVMRRTASGFDSTDYPAPPNPPEVQPIYQVGYFNGDAYIDILVTYRLQNKKILFATDATGAITRTEYDHRFYSYNFHNKVFADFDGDGREEVVQMTSGITNSDLFLNDVTSITFLKNVCDRPGQPRIVDFDATGNTDYSVWNPLSGDWSWKATPYDNETHQTETVNWGLGSLGDIPTPGDFDGDGITDRAVFRNSTGYWYIRMSSNASWFVFPFGLTGDKPVVGDYDGDTITDIAVYRPSTGIWYQMKSSNGEIATTRWGLEEDLPTPADFDGDGRADIAIRRPSNRVMYIIRSYDSSIVYQYWGNEGDILQIGDYDGDFVADLGFYRPSNGLWGDSTGRGTILGGGSSIPVSSMVIGH